jgi:hypothetical protein
MGAVVIDAPVTSEVGFRLDAGLEGFCRVLCFLVVVDLCAKIVTIDDIITVRSLVTLFSICVLAFTPDVDPHGGVFIARLMSVWKLLLLLLLLVRKLELFFFGKHPMMRSHKPAAASSGMGRVPQCRPCL